MEHKFSDKSFHTTNFETEYMKTIKNIRKIRKLIPLKVNKYSIESHGTQSQRRPDALVQ